MNKLIKKLQELFSAPKRLEEIPLVYDRFDWDKIEMESIMPPIRLFGNEILSEYEKWRLERPVLGGLSFFDNEKSRGFAIVTPLVTEKNEILLGFIKHLIKKARAENYVVKIAEISTRQSNVGLVTKYHVYLKPQYSFDSNTKTKQLYGNIILEFKLDDGKAAYFKMMSNVYSDRNFETAYTTQQMMDYFLGN